jgi:rRNA maturation endonuclease Nob1
MSDSIYDMRCLECGDCYDALSGEQYRCPSCGSADVVERRNETEDPFGRKNPPETYEEAYRQLNERHPE